MARRLTRRGTTVAGVVSMGIIGSFILGGCSGGSASNEADAGGVSSSATPTPTPTGPPPEVVWAGQFCSDRTALDQALGSFGRGLKFDTSGDLGKQLDTQLRADALKVGQALGGLVATLALVPPELPGVASHVKAVAESGTSAQATIDALGAQITAVTEADGLLDAASKVPAAIASAQNAYSTAETFVKEANKAFSGDDPALRAAMAQAPQCDGF